MVLSSPAFFKSLIALRTVAGDSFISPAIFLPRVSTQPHPNYHIIFVFQVFPFFMFCVIIGVVHILQRVGNVLLINKLRDTALLKIDFGKYGIRIIDETWLRNNGVV